MARSKDSDNIAPVSAPDAVNNNPTQAPQIQHPSPDNKVQLPNTQLERTMARKFSSRLSKIIFQLHLILVAVLVIYLTIRGLVLAHRRSFYPERWYIPVLASAGCAGIFSITWQCFTNSNPSRAIRFAFWFGPLLVLGVGTLYLTIGSAAGLGLGVVAIIFSIAQSLYTCWVSSRFDYATRVLAVSNKFNPAKSFAWITLAVITSTMYSCFLLAGIEGATIISTRIDIVFILIIFLSLTWTSQVIKNVVHVTVSHIKYMHFAYGEALLDTRQAFFDAIKNLLGSICVGSILVPIIVVIRGLARALSSITGGADEFLFSCVDCYSNIASTLIAKGNRWGFVHLGVYDKGFVQASSDTWELFKNAGLESLIDSDLTGSFCFYCGMMGGAICSLLSGSWEFAIYRSYTMQVSICTFLIGYFTCRVALAWTQASVSAFYVAYAENHRNPQLGSIIPSRIQDIQRSQA